MIKSELSKYGLVYTDKSFNQLTTLKVGGSIQYYFEPSTMYNLTLALNFIESQNLDYKIIGNGSNMLCSDKDYNGVIIKLNNLNHYEINGNEMYVEAGVPIIVAANFAINNGLSGLQFATGIPATLGGVIFMNAGAYNEAISDVIDSVLVYKDNHLEWILIDDLKFGYRTSTFQDKLDWTIVAANLILEEDEVSKLKEISISRNQRRFDTQPYTAPNCGSVFRNLDNTPVWKIIDDLDMRGKIIGGAQVSEKHSNFICNINNSSANDVNELINEIIRKTKEKCDIDLHLEVEKFNW